MTIVLAALDSSAAARPVLDTAIGLAAVTGAAAHAVHVRENATTTPEALAAQRNIPFREVSGPVHEALLSEFRADDVIVGVLGARGTPTGRRPVGRTAMRVLADVAKPVAVVPPDAVRVSTTAPRRLLVPLEGTAESSEPVAQQLVPLLVPGVELVVVHVFTTSTAPTMIDHPDWGLEAWRSEFLARHCPEAAVIDLRTGSVGGRIIEAAADAGAQLIVLSWSQDVSPGRAAVVRTILEHSTLPVLLLPGGHRPAEAPVEADLSGRRR